MLVYDNLRTFLLLTRNYSSFSLIFFSLLPSLPSLPSSRPSLVKCNRATASTNCDNQTSSPRTQAMSVIGIYRHLTGKVGFLWMLNRTELFAHLCEVSILRGEEVDVLIVAEECVYVVSLSQNIPTPAIQHSNFQK